MSAQTAPELNGVSETLLMTLYARAVESQRPDAMIRDDRAVAIVRRMDCDFSRLRMHGHDEVAVIMRMREFDRFALKFLARNPESAVVHIGCGLDTRFERVDDGTVEWVDLDLPRVIELRKELIGGEADRYHLVCGSIFEDAWMDGVSAWSRRPFLFLAEGVFPYFKEAQIKSLFLKIRDHFPGAEVVCDAHTPFVMRADNLQLAMGGVEARLHWGLKHGRDVEAWGEGISMLEEWFYFDRPEPRFEKYRWMRRIPFLGRSTGIFHYRLGQPLMRS